MKLSLLIGLMGVILVSGCTAMQTVQQPKNLASAASVILGVHFEPIINASKLVINIILNESITNATINILLPEELAENNTIVWSGDINKNEPVLIEVSVNEDVSGNFSIETILETNSTEFTGNITATESVEVTPSTTKAEGGVSGGGVVAWDPCAKPRSYKACVTGFSCFIADQPRKGENFTSYFASLNITDEYIYGMLQFDGCWGLPEDEWLNTLGRDNFTLFDAMGDHTFFFKAPRSVLTTKRYDFIRWVGVVENSSLKIEPALMNDVTNTSNASIRFIITAYEVPTENQYQTILSLINELPPYSGRDIHMSVIANASQVSEIAKLNFVKKTDKWYDVFKE